MKVTESTMSISAHPKIVGERPCSSSDLAKQLKSIAAQKASRRRPPAKFDTARATVGTEFAKVLVLGIATVLAGAQGGTTIGKRPRRAGGLLPSGATTSCGPR